MMAQIIPEQWLDIESNGFDRLFDSTGRCCDAFEQLTSLNLQAIRFGLAETQEALARTGAANNLPEVLCLPTLLAPAGFAQALSYGRQFFEILSALQRDSAPQQPVGAVRQRHFADSLLGGLATQSLVPCDVRTVPAMSSTSTVPVAAAAAVEREKGRPDKHATQPMHTD
jgi:phasin family protein